jgi:preprotein translocase subunit YajC
LPEKQHLTRNGAKKAMAGGFISPLQTQSCSDGADKLERQPVQPGPGATPKPEKARFMFASPAYAQAAAATGGAGATASLIAFVPYLAIFAIFYFLMIRPQQQRAKAHRAMIEAVKKGDTVVTGGGIIGKVTRVDADEIEIEAGPAVKLRVLKATLADVRDRSAPVAANDSKG